MNIARLRLPLMLLLPVFAHATSVSGIDTAGFDPSVRIQDDLYMATNGKWMQTASIPADSDSFGVFRQLRDTNQLRSRELIEQAAGNRMAPAEVHKMVELYQSFMQEDRLQRLGSTPIRAELQRIAAIRDPADVARMVGALQRSPAGMPWQLSVDPAADNASANLLQIQQGGLGLPDRDYYLGNDARFIAARQAYSMYLTKLFTLAGFGNVGAMVRDVIEMETRLARIQLDKVSNRDPQKTWNPRSPARLAKMAPGIDWPVFFLAARVPAVTRLNVQQTDYLNQVATLVHAVPVGTWRDYLTARVLSAYAPYLSKPFVDAEFEFSQRALAGVESPKPRWKNGVALVEQNMGETLGKLYVKRYFPPEAKTRMDGLVHNLMQAYGQSIDTLTWMSPATREAARQKLAKYRVKIGYPTRWRDYSALRILADDLAGNVRRGAAFRYDDQLSRLGKPVDREEWLMTPQTVNAYYDPTKNEIVFPAGILQPPFFNQKADDAVNYGAIGAVIGHEISHGFDDQGSQYDGDGNLRNWWSAEDRAHFDALANKLVAQYSAYEPLPGYFINGKLTLGENIADNAGLQIAHKAYQLSLGGKTAPVIDGMSGDQRFFIGFAQSWRNKTKDAALMRLLVTDPHSPARYRPLGAAVNADSFYTAFGVKPGDKMYKPQSERIRMW
jgi:putative endopeptidase